MIRQCAILFGCLALGELLIYFTHIPLPSSILGMGARTGRFLGGQHRFLLRAAWRGHYVLLRYYKGAVHAHFGSFRCQHRIGVSCDRMGTPVLWQSRGYAQEGR